MITTTIKLSMRERVLSDIIGERVSHSRVINLTEKVKSK